MVNTSKARPVDQRKDSGSAPTRSVSQPAIEAAHTPAFRARENLRLEEKLKAAQGSTAILYGRRGVGKSRLSTQLARYATGLPNHLILEARVRPEVSHGFGAWIDIVRQAMQWADGAGLNVAVLEPVINDLETVLEAPELVREIAPSLEQKLKFFDAVLRLLAQVAQHSRMLLILHNLDCADSDTLELAHFVSENLFDDPRLETGQQRPGLILYLLREGQPNSPSVENFLSVASEHPNVDCVHLQGLDLEGLREYVQSEHILNKLLSASDGLPQQIDELLDGLPTNVEALFERRLAELKPEDRQLLESLAVFGRPATAHELSCAINCAPSQTAKNLRSLRDQKVLERHIENGEIRFRFARNSNLEITLENLDSTQIAIHHDGWVQVLSLSNHPTNTGQLAYHYLHSSHPEQGVSYAVRAADAQAVAGAFGAASTLLNLALPHTHDEQRQKILSQLINLAALRGQTVAASQYLDAFKAGIAVQDRGPVLLKEARLLNQSGNYDDAIHLLNTARTLLQSNEAQVELETTLAEAQYQTGNLEQAQTAGHRGLSKLDCAEEVACVQQRIELLNLLGKVAVAQQEYRQALDYFEQTLAIAQEKRIGHSEARAFINLGVTHLKDGNLNDAEDFLQRGVDSAQQGDHLERIAFGCLNLGVLFHQRGDLSTAIEKYSQCRSLFRRLGNRTQLARVFYNLGLLYRIVGDSERARAHNDKAQRLAKHTKVLKLETLTGVFEARLKADAGQYEDAKHCIQQIIERSQSHDQKVPAAALIEYGEILMESGNHGQALEVLKQTQVDLPQSSALSLRARSQMLIGRCLSKMGQPDAQKTLLAAKQNALSLKERLLLRDVEIALASHRISVSQVDAAKAHLQTARKIQAEIGAELSPNLQLSFVENKAQEELERLAESLLGEVPVIHAQASTKVAAPRKQRPSSGFIVTKKDRTAWNQNYASIVGHSPSLHKVFKIVDRIAPSDSTVLIYGESGTGKELIAEAVHQNSPRSSGPFVKLNCAALVESLLLSELFGHERGAFTGAHQRKVGRFEQAANGTLFLDEIGDISPKTQVALLRVLQEYEFERVGGNQTLKLQARVIFATNRNLSQMVRDGLFREDLYYRLKGFSLELPALRERSEDIEALAQHFLKKHTHEGDTAKSISRDAIQALNAYHWPGNIRELENVIRSIALFADSKVIDRVDLEEFRELFEAASFFEDVNHSQVTNEETVSKNPDPVRLASRLLKQTDGAQNQMHTKKEDLLSEIFEKGISLAEFKRQLQDRAIVQALEATDGNITRAAEMLGMKRPRLSQIINANEAFKRLCQGGSK